MPRNTLDIVIHTKNIRKPSPANDIDAEISYYREHKKAEKDLHLLRYVISYFLLERLLVRVVDEGTVCHVNRYWQGSKIIKAISIWCLVQFILLNPSAGLE